MKNPYGNVVLITGASSGIGKATATILMNEGFRVYGTSRNAKNILEQKTNNTGFLEMISLDVTKDESINTAINYILEKEGKIDILINNAGNGIAGSIEDTSFTEAKFQMEVNYFGTLNMIRNVLPIMRKNKNGLIINLSSVAGVISIPYQSMYSASKSAIEAITEALRIEVKPFGIKATAVQPGDTKTGFTGSRIYSKNAENEASPYYKSFNKSIKKMENDEINGVSPDKVAKVILNVIKRKNPPIKKTVGFGYKLLVLLKRILPSKVTELFVSMLYS